MHRRYDSSAASSLYSNVITSRASSTTAVVTPVDDFRSSRYVHSDALAPVGILDRGKNLSNMSTTSSGYTGRTRYARQLARNPSEMEPNGPYFSLPLHPSQQQTSLARRLTTKELIGEYEELSSKSPVRSARTSVVSSNGPNLAAPEQEEQLEKTKKGRSPIRQSFRNLLSVFSKKGRPVKETKNEGVDIATLLTVPEAKLEPLTIPETSLAPTPTSVACTTPFSFSSGPLLHLSRPISPNSLPVWTACDVKLHSTHILVTWTSSQGNPSTSMITLGQCTDVRSLALCDLDNTERELLPVNADLGELRVFELLFEGKAREKFAAASVKERAGWVAAIWDAVLRTSEEKIYTPSASVYEGGSTLGKIAPSVIDAQSTIDHARESFSEIQSSPASTTTSRDLPSLPPSPTPPSRVPSSPVRVTLYDPPVPRATPPPSPVRSLHSRFTSPAPQIRSQSPSIRNLDQKSVVKQRLAEIELTASQSNSSDLLVEKSTLGRQIRILPDSPNAIGHRSVLLRHGTITTIGSDSESEVDGSVSQSSPLSSAPRRLVSIPSGETIGTEKNPWSMASRLPTPRALQGSLMSSPASRYSVSSAATERSASGFRSFISDKPLPTPIELLESNASGHHREAASTSVGTKEESQSRRSTRTLSIFSPSSPYSFHAIAKEQAASALNQSMGTDKVTPVTSDSPQPASPASSPKVVLAYLQPSPRPSIASQKPATQQSELLPSPRFQAEQAIADPTLPVTLQSELFPSHCSLLEQTDTDRPPPSTMLSVHLHCIPILPTTLQSEVCPSSTAPDPCPPPAMPPVSHIPTLTELPNPQLTHQKCCTHTPPCAPLVTPSVSHIPISPELPDSQLTHHQCCTHAAPAPPLAESSTSHMPTLPELPIPQPAQHQHCTPTGVPSVPLAMPSASHIPVLSELPDPQLTHHQCCTHTAPSAHLAESSTSHIPTLPELPNPQLTHHQCCTHTASSPPLAESSTSHMPTLPELPNSQPAPHQHCTPTAVPSVPLAMPSASHIPVLSELPDPQLTHHQCCTHAAPSAHLAESSTSHIPILPELPISQPAQHQYRTPIGPSAPLSMPSAPYVPILPPKRPEVQSSQNQYTPPMGPHPSLAKPVVARAPVLLGLPDSASLQKQDTALVDPPPSLVKPSVPRIPDLPGLPASAVSQKQYHTHRALTVPASRDPLVPAPQADPIGAPSAPEPLPPAPEVRRAIVNRIQEPTLSVSPRWQDADDSSVTLDGSEPAFPTTLFSRLANLRNPIPAVRAMPIPSCPEAAEEVRTVSPTPDKASIENRKHSEEVRTVSPAPDGASIENQKRLEDLATRITAVQADLQNLPNELNLAMIEQISSIPHNRPVEDTQTKQVLTDIDDAIKRIEDQGELHAQGIHGIHAKVDALLSFNKFESASASSSALDPPKISGLPNDMPSAVDTSSIMSKLEEMRAELKNDLPMLANKLPEILAQKTSEEPVNMSFLDSENASAEATSSPTTFDDTAIHAKLDEMLTALKESANAKPAVEEQVVPDDEPHPMLDQVLELLNSDKAQRAQVIEQQGDSARYLNELNTWLETFVNHGTSQIDSVATNVQQICAELGPRESLGEDGQPIRHAGVLTDIRQLLLDNKGRDDNVSSLHGDVHDLLGLVQEDLRQGAELRGGFNHEAIVGLIDRQRQDQENMLRALALELSSDIRGERLRFVEAMKEATTINVQIHVEEFKKELTREVLSMTQEVARLHKERQGLEQQIADLFAFYAKQKQTAATEPKKKVKQPQSKPPSQDAYLSVPGATNGFPMPSSRPLPNPQPRPPGSFS